ncbi:glycosyltransferase [Psychrobacter sp. DM4]|uniref:glycosyltransferase n=1 Tax=Psychrobacter sp. DM4 TaxID=3440637 RepID=UPI003F4F644A
MNIAIVIPAHNEELTISDCLASVQTAIERLPSTITVNTLVVLDSCTDDTLSLVKDAGIDYISCDYRCVGQVRDLGVRHAIAQGATWIACTDADTLVATEWLEQQMAHITDLPINSQSTDMICGVVSVDSWAHLTPKTRDDYLAHYQDTMNHRHIHGANLSFSSETYIAVGGFAALQCHEDVDLVKKFEKKNYVITWSNRVRVTTSSRLQARASEGFAAFLATIEKDNKK